MTKKNIIICILLTILFVTGYILGALLHPKASEWIEPKEQAEIQIEKLFGEGIADLHSGIEIDMDTLAAHEKNLLIFWSPTCNYCKRFFQNNLNSESVGIFCIPLTDDIEYVDYYIKKHNIVYSQLVLNNSNTIHSIDEQCVKAIPMFYVLNSQGEVLMEHRGINNIDDFIENLYKK